MKKKLEMCKSIISYFKENLQKYLKINREYVEYSRAKSYGYKM